MITVINNTNTLLRVAYPVEDEGEIVEIVYEPIIGWQISTELDTNNVGPDEHTSSATPITSSGMHFDPHLPHAIVNKFTEEWEIPYDHDDRGFEKLLKYWQLEQKKKAQAIKKI